MSLLTIQHGVNSDHSENWQASWLGCWEGFPHMLSRYNGLDSIILCINAGPGCNVSENLIHNGVVVESYCVAAQYFNRGITYQTKAKRLFEMTVIMDMSLI